MYGFILFSDVWKPADVCFNRCGIILFDSMDNGIATSNSYRIATMASRFTVFYFGKG